MATINYLTTIEFDFGAVRKLGDSVRALGIRRPLLVTDAGLARSDVMARVLDALGNPQPTVFDGTPQNPDESAVEDAVALHTAAGCDGVIALGGGSPIDLGKAVALLATHAGPLEQYALIGGGLARITAKVAPLIAIPTTAGTGSEVGRGALITLNDGRKLGFISPHMIPKVALCDPELTLGLPAHSYRGHRHGCVDPLHRDVSCRRASILRRTRSRWMALHAPHAGYATRSTMAPTAMRAGT